MQNFSMQNFLFFFSPNVPREYLSVRGAVLLLSILDHDKIGSDDFAGEIAIHLSSISPMEMSTTVDSKPAVMLPIKRPTSHTEGPYKVWHFHNNKNIVS